MITLTQEELELLETFKALKAKSGTHSPSMRKLIQETGLKIATDACFLSNPYATELFLRCLKTDVIEKDELRQFLEWYPAHNSQIAGTFSDVIGVPPSNVLIGNGAVEIIQAAMHNFCEGKTAVNLPTFSSYYEFIRDPNDLCYFYLPKENGYQLPVEDYLRFIRDNEIRNCVIINPNNPDGGYVNTQKIGYLLEELRHLDTVILDESFIHFASENDDLSTIPSAAKLVLDYDNLIIVKSMSKDFGIAGIRAGYGLMSEKRVSSLLENGYLWNSNGLSEYFFELFGSKDFHSEYERIRRSYIRTCSKFIDAAKTLPNSQCYDTQANFILLELENGITAEAASLALLCRHGVYARNCSDKIGLEGQFLRVAIRSEEDNNKILLALRDILSV